MKYHRSLWEGTTRYTSLTTGQTSIKEERLAFVQGFDSRGLLHGSFKVAYIDSNGNATLKLALTNRVKGQAEEPPWYECDDGPFYLYTTSDMSLEGNNNVGDINAQYDHPAAGRVSIWTLKPYRSYQTWRYEGFWGLPLTPVFDPPLAEEIVSLPQYNITGLPPTMDGWGHMTKGSIVRTMVYSVPVGGKMTNICLKSSDLLLTRQEIQDEPFERFID